MYVCMYVCMYCIVLMFVPNVSAENSYNVVTIHNIFSDNRNQKMNLVEQFFS